VVWDKPDELRAFVKAAIAARQAEK
jgi:hypothetical protein